MPSFLVLSFILCTPPQTQWELPGGKQAPGQTKSLEEAESVPGTVPFVADLDVVEPETHVEAAPVAFDPLWAECPSNGHWYGLTTQMDSWLSAEKEAIAVGGHLVTIQDFQTIDWLKENFGEEKLWIGLRRHSSEGLFSWSSGEIVNFRFWSWGRPDNLGQDENFVYMNHNIFGEWNDGGGKMEPMALRGVVELLHPPGDFDGDGLLDDLEIVLGTNPQDWDTDDDGLSDAEEHNGKENGGWETDPIKWDSDGDGLSDGQEIGITTGIPGIPNRQIPGTNLALFQPDSDPETQTDPTRTDTDQDGESDGSEDTNLDGKKGLDENDPLDPTDQGMILRSSVWQWGGLALLEIRGLEPGARVEILISKDGVKLAEAGTHSVDTLAGAIKRITFAAAGTSGDVRWLLPLPEEAFSEGGLWLQALERGRSGSWRLSPPIEIVSKGSGNPTP